MMVGNYRQHLACVAAQPNGVKRHRTMKPSSRDSQLGLASLLNYAAIESGKTKTLEEGGEAGRGWMQATTASARAGERIFC
jgi:hypothetical protein